MTKDKAAKIITNEIYSRAKLNKADLYLKRKNEIEKIIENKTYHWIIYKNYREKC
jgi:hypothetical protein